MSYRRSRVLCLFSLGASLLPLLTTELSAVSVRDFYYTLTNITITAGDTVNWTNNGANSHDVTEGQVTLAPGVPRLFQTSQFGANGVRSWTFTNVGYYPYFCSPHVNMFPQQTGTVTVLPPLSLPLGAAITTPAQGARFTNAFTVQLVGNGASRDSKLARIEFFVGGSFVGSDAIYPYTVLATNLPTGTNLLTAVAVDVDGLRGTSAPVAIVLTNIVRTNVIAMSASAFSPSSLTVSAGSTVIWSNTQAIAHTATGDPAGLEPLCGPGVSLVGAVRCTNVFMTPGAYPYSCSIHPTMRGTVFVSQASSSPFVRLTSPVSGITLANNSIVFEADAADPDGIGRVQFFRAPNTLLGQVADAPYKISAIGSMSAGTFSFFARAIDGQGFGNVSAPVSMTFGAPLQLLGATNLGGNFQFLLTTTPGLTYVTERSGTLGGGFTPFRTNTATISVLLISDPITGTETQKFYRAFLQP